MLCNVPATARGYTAGPTRSPMQEEPDVSSPPNPAIPDGISATRDWVETFVVGLSICPFAAREVADQRVRYVDVSARDWSVVLTRLIEECQRLDRDEGIETTLLVLSEGVDAFDDYLDLLELAEALLADQGYEGTYQLASFHPEYRFADGEPEAVEHYTNRSPWPILHVLREDSLSRVLDRHPAPQAIPERNMALMAELGRERLVRQLATWRAR